MMRLVAVLAVVCACYATMYEVVLPDRSIYDVAVTIRAQDRTRNIKKYIYVDEALGLQKIITLVSPYTHNLIMKSDEGYIVYDWVQNGGCSCQINNTVAFERGLVRGQNITRGGSTSTLSAKTSRTIDDITYREESVAVFKNDAPSTSVPTPTPGPVIREVHNFVRYEQKEAHIRVSTKEVLYLFTNTVFYNSISPFAEDTEQSIQQRPANCPDIITCV
ncbi:hypothetical protein AKO1_011120 [Acrasis kona]|uniref:Uncharacterized protein n=1 Tax=Acrasis kona TaxID=1008807 RepID=A0AAW2YZZ3_9EUKA